jgi:succinate dehydrogenase/fumarate reductase flavoprotein subunit
MVESIDADLIVLGGGMGGTTAAFAAAKQGKKVILIEKAAASGGSALLSGTHVRTARSLEQLREKAPTGDPELQAAFIEGFPRTQAFIKESGVEVSEDLDVLYGRGNRFDVVTYLHRATAAITGAGGIVALSTEVSCLLTDDSGRVVGVRAHDADGMTDLRASAVILATGGFQGNKHYMTKYMGERAARLLHRSNPDSTGDGLRLAIEAGAVTKGNMATYYGHLIASPLPEFLPGDFVRHAFIFSDRCMLVNIEGVRFAQEWLGDHLNTQRVAEQPQGRAVLVFDQRVRREFSRAPVVKGTEAVDSFDEATDRGCRTASAQTLEELGEAIVAWGITRPDLAVCAEQHEKEASDAGVTEPLTEAPFYAVEVRPGITFTEGGLAIDTHARVLDRSGAPIPGLYAAGADTGGVFDGGYSGGLALAGTFGLIAVADILGT